MHAATAAAAAKKPCRLSRAELSLLRPASSRLPPCGTVLQTLLFWSRTPWRSAPCSTRTQTTAWMCAFAPSSAFRLRLRALLHFFLTDKTRTSVPASLS